MMLRALSAIFSLSIAAAGWYYMFYSQAASRLGTLEAASTNSLRIWLRRINGLLMFLLAVCFFAGFFAVDMEHPTKMTAFVWLAVCFLVLALLALGLIDLRLTWRLRSSQQPDFRVEKRQ